VLHGENDHPALAHVHVELRVRNSDRALEACVVGVGSARAEALSAAAHSWVLLVAAPLLSLVHTRPLLDAEHFTGEQPWGVPDRHGFVGPASARGDVDSIEMGSLGSAPFFTGADELAGDGRLHLVKSIVTNVDGKWKRTLELDGHAATRIDDDYQLGIKAPERFAICTRFAVFFAGHDPKELPN
jgi:hypothetical protein